MSTTAPQSPRLEPRGRFTLHINLGPEFRAGTAKVRGTETGLGIGEFVRAILEANELLDAKRKLTDEELGRLLANEFPHARSVLRMREGQITFRYFRSQYHHGTYSGGQRPALTSHRYTRVGGWGVPADAISGEPLDGKTLEEIQAEIAAQQAAAPPSVRIRASRVEWAVETGGPRRRDTPEQE